MTNNLHIVADDASLSSGLTENSDLSAQYQHVREQSVFFCQKLELEDYSLQAMPETSPPKWHLAHTSWFFETFILKVFVNDYQPFHPSYEYLFNSYYNGIGEQFPRPQRGLLSRPSVAEVFAYRQYVDVAILRLMKDTSHPDHQQICERVILGLHHEQQHQELFFTDIKYSLSCNPLNPVYESTSLDLFDSSRLEPVTFRTIGAATVNIGYQQSSDHKPAFDHFNFDNELPVHTVNVQAFEFAERLVSNAEYMAFMSDGGYENPVWWLSDGWAEAKQQQWCAPLYWRQVDGEWFEFTLHGLQPINPNSPVCHVSAYEADAYARWAGARLPSEYEWEAVAQCRPVSGHFVESEQYHPQAMKNGESNIYGSVWEWTSSAYGAYPGFMAVEGAIGEYNGKFMCNQLVLRGGSCVSSKDHLRASYRNFFYPRDRWQFSGIRLAKTLC